MNTQSQSNQERQTEEIYVLQSIYGLDSVTISDSNSESTDIIVNLPIEELNATPRIKFILPIQYPSHVPPIYEILPTLLNGSDLGSENRKFLPKELFLLSSVFHYSDKMYNEIKENFNDIWENQFKGEVVIFTWLEWLIEYLRENWKIKLETSNIQNNENDCSQKQDFSLEINESDVDKQVGDVRNVHKQVDDVRDVDKDIEIFQGEAVEKKKSIFIGFVAKVKSEKEVQEFKGKLLKNPRIEKATHNILAFRIKLDNGYYAQDNDDDGESAAGKRLLTLLVNIGADNVAVIVSRWYGGIHLGPERFKLINSAARSALELAGIKG
ncbi:hypothetical protein BB558_005004 [Smittium angustum]|uniref:RWD domain-containing protein n=1 Tax=Smittium angustum TaxID=133377 RepID=A0A2U1J1P7_SMIAN|nr:hypothetical protein BB558_005004 [Smittium angustum]